MQQRTTACPRLPSQEGSASGPQAHIHGVAFSPAYYPQTGIWLSTLFGDWRVDHARTDNKSVEIKELRRSRLRQWIVDQFAGNASEFARFVKRTQPQIQDMLDGRKSFGEKVARSIEKAARMPPGHLDDVRIANEVREPAALYHGVMLTRAGALLGAEWEKLQLSDRIEVEQDIQARVARHVREARKKLKDGPNRPKD